MDRAECVEQEVEFDASERRKGMPAIPLNLRAFLSDDQRQALRQVEGFGWSLAFVRRPLFQDPTVVLQNPDHVTYSVLEDDGTVNEQPDIIIRH
ncbi:hypothetical protein [Agaribacterium haliotis]|uniref:hypothetical protein n=1 Tax=Agaribacterium haliotis TaxID=2013869 RepID=UPI00195990AA|nr:hypothetical protein [Agaribacterium haliotis]